MLSWMQPRDEAVAGRTVAWLFGAAVVASVVLAPLEQGGWLLSGRILAVSLVLVALGLGVSFLTRLPSRSGWIWVLCPLLGVAALTSVDLYTRDASIGAQIYFVFAVLYGASCLPRAGAAVMTAVSVLGETLVVAAQLPLPEALNAAGAVCTALVSTSALLVRSNERQAALVRRLQDQAAIDPLTGLVTRRVLDEAAASALSGAENSEGTSLVLLDVDRFKQVNDVLGHLAGDEVLVQLAAILARRSRPHDVVCRMGGDEIALLLPGCSADTAQLRAEAIVADVRAHDFVLSDAEPIRVTVSMGLAHAPTQATELRALYAAADAALYAAKRGGRDQVLAAVA